MHQAGSVTDILYAQAAFDLGNYATAADKAISAFNNCNEVHAIAHLARVKELYMKLLASDHRDYAEVKHLGKLLSTVFPRNSK